MDGEPVFPTPSERAEAIKNMDPFIGAQVINEVRAYSRLTHDLVRKGRESVDGDGFQEDAVRPVPEVEQDSQGD